RRPARAGRPTGRERCRGRCSCRVRAVLVDVVVSEVVGPHRDGGLARVQVDVDADFACGDQVDACAVLTHTAATADRDAVDGDVDGVRLERSHLGRDGTGGGEDPAPVGVVSVDRRLDEVGAGDGTGDGERGVLGGGAGDGDGDVVGGAFGVGD